MEKQNFKWKLYIRIKKDNVFPKFKLLKFRLANALKIYFLGLDVEIGLPYLKKYIYQSGFDRGFTSGYKARQKGEKNFLKRSAN